MDESPVDKACFSLATQAQKLFVNWVKTKATQAQA